MVWMPICGDKDLASLIHERDKCVQQFFLATGFIRNEMCIIYDEQINIAKRGFKGVNGVTSVAAAHRADKSADKSFRRNKFYPVVGVGLLNSVFYGVK